VASLIDRAIADEPSDPALMAARCGFTRVMEPSRTMTLTRAERDSAAMCRVLDIAARAGSPRIVDGS
jgi:hypothetical protein